MTPGSRALPGMREGMFSHGYSGWPGWGKKAERTIEEVVFLRMELLDAWVGRAARVYQ